MENLRESKNLIDRMETRRVSEGQTAIIDSQYIPRLRSGLPRRLNQQAVNGFSYERSIIPELVPKPSVSMPVLFSKLTNRLHNGVLLFAS